MLPFHRTTMIAAAGILAIVILSGTFVSFSNRVAIETTSVAKPVSTTVASPQETSVTPTNHVSSVETSVVERNSVAVSKSADAASSSIHATDFLLFKLKQAFAIPSTQTIVTVDEWPVGAHRFPEHIAVDSSGNVFFAMETPAGQMINKIAVLQQSSVNPNQQEIVEWTAPRPSNGLSGIAVDSSGNVFFTYEDNDKISRLAPTGAGAITEWTIPTASSGSGDVKVDSAGNVFFVESTGNKIARLVPSTNTITEWTLPAANSMPAKVAVDSSGNVFFALRDTGKIARLVPSTNTITEWLYGLTILGIAVDSSGNVFFVNIGAGVTRLVPSTNTMTSWGPLGTNFSLSSGIAVDSAGNVFLPVSVESKILRLS